MVADIVGYSRLMEADEEGTAGRLAGWRSLLDAEIAKCDGRVFKAMGDAVLAEFASAVEAVRCATEVQAALRTRNEQLPPARQVKFRLGINLGDVMVDGDDLLGDGVNVAARLQAAAEPGGICISGSVYDQIRNKLSLSFKSLGEQSFKNIPQPVRTFTITESAAEGRLPSRHLALLRAPAQRWLVAAALAIGVGYSLYAWMAPGVVQDGLYAGAVCFGPSRNDPARCFRAQGILSDGTLSGRWPGRDPGVTMFLAGEVSKAGAVKIEMHGETADGTRMPTINLVGTLRGGEIDAAGNFEGFGRTATLKWQRQ